MTNTTCFPIPEMWKVSIDKQTLLWLNDNCTYEKTLTENSLSVDAAESRRVVRAGAEALSDLIPESVL